MLTAMMNRGFLLFVALAFAAGFWARGFWGVSSRPESEIALPAETSAGSGELQKMVDVDVAEYYRLKDSETKYQKADELLGKMVLLFLSDLGMRVDPATLAGAKRSLAKPVEAAAPEKASGPVVSNQPPAGPAPARNGATPPEGVPQAPPSPVVDWRAKEKALAEVRNEADISDFLSKTKFDSPESIEKSFAGFTNQNKSMASFNGSFAGPGQVTISASGTTENWWIETTLRGRMRDGAPQGRLLVKISKNGKVFSNNSDAGEIASLRDLPGSDAMIIAASPSIYFQLYHLKEQDQIIGNIYRRDSQTKPLKYIGTLSLSRAR